MQGKFNNTTIVLMGCDGLTFDTTAKAFVKKGAGVVIGWNSLVSASHTDAAIQSLMPKLASQKLTFSQAISQTMAEIGKDAELRQRPRGLSLGRRKPHPPPDRLVHLSRRSS